MTETVVHVTTLEQWKSVLDVWFKHGYAWYSSRKKYNEKYFRKGKRYLLLDCDNDILIPTPGRHDCIEYSEFMAQQKEDNKMATVYVTQEQLNLIEELSRKQKPLSAILTGFSGGWGELKNIHEDLQKQTLRYLGGDTSVEFKVKEPLYRLWRIDGNGNRVYMRFTSAGTPDWTTLQKNVFIAPLEEIRNWQTPAWEIEKAD